MATVTAIKQRIAALDAGSFQILCDAYLSKEGYSNIVCLGTKEGTKRQPKEHQIHIFVNHKENMFLLNILLSKMI